MAKPVTFVTKPLPIGSPTPINKSGTVRTSACKSDRYEVGVGYHQVWFQARTARRRIWLRSSVAYRTSIAILLSPTRLLKFLSKGSNE